MGVGVEGITAATSANPQLQFFENFPGHLGAVFSIIQSANTLSVHAVNIPLSLSFNNLVAFVGQSIVTSRSASFTHKFGLYSMNAGTLSLANSASVSNTMNGVTNTSWMSFAISTTQNITPGTWYFAMLISSANGAGGGGSVNYLQNSSINPANAIPGGFLKGRMTVSTAAFPASIVTSDLDITGVDATRQPYIIITA